MAKAERHHCEQRSVMKLRSTVSVGALAGKADRGRFVRDVLRARLEDEPRVFEPLDWQEFR
jgi:hypothetical protein